MSESQVRSILESVATGDLSPAEAATLLDALAPDDQADSVPGAPLAGAPAPAAVAAPPTPPTPPNPPAAAPATQPAPFGSAGPDETHEFRRPAGFDGLTGGREQVVVSLNAGTDIQVVCAPDVSEPFADGPNTVTVEHTQHGYTVAGDVGADSVVMLPADLDLTITANGVDFSLSGLVGTVSADLNCADVNISGVFARGDSRIHANAADINLTLLAGSDVEVIAKAPSTMSADGLEHVGRGRWSLGDGTAKILIEGNVGGINLRTD